MISKKRRNLIFLEAFLLTFLIYLLSFVATDFLDDKREEELKLQIAESEVIFDSAFTSSFFFEFLLDESCNSSKTAILDQYVELKSVGKGFQSYSGLFLEMNEKSLKSKQRNYYLNQILLYNYVEIYNNRCEEEVTPVIYFFDGSQDFDRQSLVLEQFALNNKNETIILSFDYDFEDENLLNKLKEKYEVNKPSYLVIGNITSNNIYFPEGLDYYDLNTINLAFMRARGELQ
jgi:hypothetical protein